MPTKKRLQEATVTIGRDENGKAIRKHVYAKTKTELARKKADIVANLKVGRYADDKNTTLKVYADKWLSTYKSSREQATYDGYANIIKNHVPNIIDLRLSEITATNIQEVINAASGHWDIQRRIKLTLSQILECAIDDGLVYRNVASRTEVPSKPKTERRPLLSAEKDALHTACFTDEELAFVSIARYTGMRPEEIRALKVEDIDLESAVITVRRAEVFDSSGKPIIKDTKTSAGRRYLPILDPLMPILSSYVSSRDGFLFIGERSGEPLSKSSYRRFWKRILAKIEDKTGECDLTPYAFRHDFATTLYYAGIDLKEAKRLMGHSDSRMILEVYAHLDEIKSASTTKLNQFFS